MVRSEDSKPPIPWGVRFRPTDDEIFKDLKLKTIRGSDYKDGPIPEVEVYTRDAWDLPFLFNNHFETNFPDCSTILANQWYFFCPQEGKNRAARSTKSGFWKLTGPDRKIKSQDTDTDTEIGTKRTVVFHTGRARDSNSKVTNWVIHEYHLTPDPRNPPKKGFVLCLLKYEKKKKNKKKNDNTRNEVEPSSVNGSSQVDNVTPPIPNTNHWASNAQNLVELTPEELALVWPCFSERTNQQPQMHPEQGLSDMDFSYYNAFSSNGDISHYFVSEEEYTLAESRGHRAMAARRSEMPETHLVRVSSDCSLTKECVNESSSETDTEVVIKSRVGKLCVQEVLHKEPKQCKVRESNCITVKVEGRPDSIKAKVTATKLPQKEKSIVVSNNGLGMAGGNNTKLSLKSREKEESSGRNQKGVRNFVETSLASSHGSSSPFDYAFNLVLGTIFLGLFFVVVVLDVTRRISSVFN